jgi:hypothetical protein
MALLLFAGVDMNLSCVPQEKTTKTEPDSGDGNSVSSYESISLRLLKARLRAGG